MLELLCAVTDDELVGVALPAWHLYDDTRVGADAPTGVATTTIAHVRMSL